jgi:hypothetical protein
MFLSNCAKRAQSLLAADWESRRGELTLRYYISTSAQPFNPSKAKRRATRVMAEMRALASRENWL